MNQGVIRCWGAGSVGQLGYGNTDTIGDGEAPSAAGTIDIGASIVDLAAGDHHTCAVTATADAVCWGFNAKGQLGLGDTLYRGDDEVPAAVGPVPVHE